MRVYPGARYAGRGIASVRGLPGSQRLPSAARLSGITRALEMDPSSPVASAERRPRVFSTSPRACTLQCLEELVEHAYATGRGRCLRSAGNES